MTNERKLFHATDALSGVVLKFETLYIQFAIDTENAELDGESPPELSPEEKKQLASIRTGLKAVADDIDRILNSTDSVQADPNAWLRNIQEEYINGNL